MSSAVHPSLRNQRVVLTGAALGSAPGSSPAPEPGKELVASQRLPVRILREHVASLALFTASDDGAVCTAQNDWITAGWR